MIFHSLFPHVIENGLVWTLEKDWRVVYDKSSLEYMSKRTNVYVEREREGEREERWIFLSI